MFNKKSLKKIPPILASFLILINGIVNITFAIIPLSFYRLESVSEVSKLFSYVAYQQASSILTIIVGLILISLGVGLYRKQHNSWLCAIIMLIALNIENIYPSIKSIPLTLGITTLLILVFFKQHFQVRTRSRQAHIVTAWLSAFFAISYGSVGCYLMRAQFHGIHNFTDSIYYTLVTYTTIGYGDITPITSSAKIFVVTMIIIGVGSFATVITALLGPMVERRLKRVFTMVEHLNHLRKHAILCPVNQITIQIAKDLKDNNIEVLFVDAKSEVLTEMEQLGFETLQGDASDQATLKRARLLDAHYFICAHDSDAENILLTMTAKNRINNLKPNSKIQIISKIEKPGNADNALQSGADDLIIPALLSSEKILKSLP